MTTKLEERLVALEKFARRHKTDHRATTGTAMLATAPRAVYSRLEHLEQNKAEGSWVVGSLYAHEETHKALRARLESLETFKRETLKRLDALEKKRLRDAIFDDADEERAEMEAPPPDLRDPDVVRSEIVAGLRKELSDLKVKLAASELECQELRPLRWWRGPG